MKCTYCRDSGIIMLFGSVRQCGCGQDGENYVSPEDTRMTKKELLEKLVRFPDDARIEFSDFGKRGMSVCQITMPNEHTIVIVLE